MKLFATGVELLLSTATLLTLSVTPCVAQIVVGQVDTFQDGSVQNWFGAFPENVPNAGPNGDGDNALFATANGNPFGTAGKLVIVNRGLQWDGNWTSAGVAQIGFDIRNPNSFALSMRVGVGGPGGVSGGGSMAFGDIHVSTAAISVPADNAWHTINFPVLAADFTSLSAQFQDIDAALAAVSQFRILHNVEVDFVGQVIDGDFYVDNIRALGGPTSVPGDYNRDGTVDAADYVVWRKTLDQSVPVGSGADGTGPAGTPDGLVDGLDYNFWRSRFGNSSAAAGSVVGAVTVPEPGTWVLLFGLMLASIRRRR